jgi:hypothetical protein
MKENIENMSKFFEKFSLKIYAIDIKYNLIYKYEPKSINKKINPWVLYVLVHNDHCYRLNANLKRLEQIIGKDKDEEKENEVKLNKYNFKTSEEIFTFINDLSELNQIKKDNKLIKIYYPHSIKDLCKKLIFELNYDPIIKTSGGRITSINIKLEDTNVIISNPGQNDGNMDVTFDDGKYYEMYSQYEMELYNNLLNKNTIVSIVNSYSM